MSADRSADAVLAAAGLVVVDRDELDGLRRCATAHAEETVRLLRASVELSETRREIERLRTGNEELQRLLDELRQENRLEAQRMGGGSTAPTPTLTQATSTSPSPTASSLARRGL